MDRRTRKLKNQNLQRCVYSGRLIKNKDVVITEYAVPYVRSQGYVCANISNKLPLFLALVFMIFLLPVPYVSGSEFSLDFLEADNIEITTTDATLWDLAFNTTFDTRIVGGGGNTSWNQTLATSLFAGIEWNYNQSIATYNMYNTAWSFDSNRSNADILSVCSVYNDTTSFKDSDNIYLFNDSTTFYFNETRLNDTIDSRATVSNTTGKTSFSFDGSSKFMIQVS